jgi:hypothetical protein
MREEVVATPCALEDERSTVVKNQIPQLKRKHYLHRVHFFSDVDKVRGAVGSESPLSGSESSSGGRSMPMRLSTTAHPVSQPCTQNFETSCFAFPKQRQITVLDMQKPCDASCACFSSVRVQERDVVSLEVPLAILPVAPVQSGDGTRDDRKIDL